MADPEFVVVVTGLDTPKVYGPFASKQRAETHGSVWLTDFRWEIVELHRHPKPQREEEDGPDDSCSDPAGHSWVIADSGRGEGHCYCEFCGADGDA